MNNGTKAGLFLIASLLLVCGGIGLSFIEADQAAKRKQAQRQKAEVKAERAERERARRQVDAEIDAMAEQDLAGARRYELRHAYLSLSDSQ